MVHVAMRAQLRKEGWVLVAGQFPGGSDDELPALNITDPVVARDQSPDPRRHSSGKLVPDLVALKGCTLLLIEAKVGYSDEDRQKLLEMLGPRRDDLIRALRELACVRGILELSRPQQLKIIPGLAQAADAPTSPLPPDFASIRAHSLASACVSLPQHPAVA